MLKKSNSKRGSDYEDKVHELVQKLMTDGSLPFDKNATVFHRMKSYYSNDRDSEIKFENVVELFAKRQKKQQPALVVIFECKNYESVVDISDLEEFKSKLDQLRGFRTKGYVVTTKGFRKGALNFAKSNGIGLIRFMPDDQCEFIAYYVTPDLLEGIERQFPTRAIVALTNPGYISHHESEFGFDRECVFSDIGDMVTEFIREMITD